MRALALRRHSHQGVNPDKDLKTAVSDRVLLLRDLLDDATHVGLHRASLFLLRVPESELLAPQENARSAKE